MTQQDIEQKHALCAVCGKPIYTSQTIYWIKDSRKGMHIPCGDTVLDFVKISHDSRSCIVKPEEAKDFADGDVEELQFQNIKMTLAEYESLQDFTGF